MPRHICRIALVIAIATNFGGVARAGAISFTTVAGSYSFVTQPTLDGAMTFVPARNGSGAGVGVTNGVVQSYILPSGASAFSPLGRIGNIVYGNLTIGQNDIAATFNVTAATNAWTQLPQYQILAAGPGGQFGGNDAFGNPIEATFTAAGAVTNVIHIPTLVGTIDGETLGVFGNIATGFFDNGVIGQAFCVDNGVLRSIGSGSSIGLGVNGATGSCLGSYLGDASQWALDGSLSFFSDVSGTGLFQGEDISGFGNLNILEDNSGNFFINNGTMTMALPTYCTDLGFTCNSAAYIIGDPASGTTKIEALGSIDEAAGTLAEFNVPFQQTSGTPEPSTWITLGSALLLLITWGHRRGLRRDPHRAWGLTNFPYSPEISLRETGSRNRSPEEYHLTAL